jgi:aspartate racemase
MKKLGIVGGVAWPSTIEYYKAICELSQALHKTKSTVGPPSTPEMVIESLNINKSFGLRGHGDDDASWSEFDAYFRLALQRIEASGAEIAIIASNTPHNRYDAITTGINIPVLSIFEATATECKRAGIKDILILGTAPTMDSNAFANVLAKSGVSAFSPAGKAERDEVLRLISDLQVGKINGSEERLRDVVAASLNAKSNTTAVCLGCTELPLAFPDSQHLPTFTRGAITYVNTTVIHAAAVFAMLL